MRPYVDEGYDPDPYGELADARREAAEDRFLRDAVKCADCGALWNPGWHRATRNDPGYPDQTECPRCGCGEMLAQDEESRSERFRELSVEALREWSGWGDRIGERLAQADPEDLWERFFAPMLKQVRDYYKAKEER